MQTMSTIIYCISRIATASMIRLKSLILCMCDLDVVAFLGDSIPGSNNEFFEKFANVLFHIKKNKECFL